MWSDHPGGGVGFVNRLRVRGLEEMFQRLVSESNLATGISDACEADRVVFGRHSIAALEERRGGAG